MDASLPDIRAIVFDLDDTLYPEHQYVKSGFRAVSQHLLRQGIVSCDVYPAMLQRFTAGERAAVFDHVLQDCGIQPAPALVRKLVAVYRGHRPDISLFPDAAAVLGFFRGRKKLALLTDGYVQTQSAKLEALDIRHFFDSIVLTDQLGRDSWKPSTAGFEKIMRDLGEEAREYVYIGDNPLKDFAAPRRLGWLTICVRRPEGVYADAIAPEESYCPAFHADSLYQAARLLDVEFTR